MEINKLSEISDEELLAEVAARKFSREEVRIKTLSIATNKRKEPLTNKDVLVRYFKNEDFQTGDKLCYEYLYNFSVEMNGRSKSFYYGDHGAGEDIFLFVPKGFADSMEDVYETRLELSDAIKTLEKLGYKVRELKEGESF